MMRNRERTSCFGWIIRLASVVILACCLAGMTDAQTPILIDDFNDGNDDGWTPLDTLDPPPKGGGPGIFDASSFEYNLASTGPVEPGGAGVTSIWDGSAAPQFNNGFLRAKVRAETENTFADLEMRGDPVNFSLYIFGGSAASGDFSIFAFDPVAGGRTVAELVDPPVPFSAGVDWIFEAGTVGDQLSFKFWRDGDPEPTAPQLTATDSSYPSGLFGVGNSAAGDAMEPGIISSFYDDVFFTVPEPSTFALFTLAMGGLLYCRRRLKTTKL